MKDYEHWAYLLLSIQFVFDLVHQFDCLESTVVEVFSYILVQRDQRIRPEIGKMIVICDAIFTSSSSGCLYWKFAKQIFWKKFFFAKYNGQFL